MLVDGLDLHIQRGRANGRAVHKGSQTDAAQRGRLTFGGYRDRHIDSRSECPGVDRTVVEVLQEAPRAGLSLGLRREFAETRGKSAME